MDTIDPHLIDRLAEKILNLPCDYAEARIAAGLSTTIVLSNDQVDMISAGDFIGGSVRVLVRGRWGFVSFNDIDSAIPAADRALTLAGKILENRDTGILHAGPLAVTGTTVMETDFRAVPLEQKFELLNSYNSILRNGSTIQTTRAVYRDSHVIAFYLNSENSRVRHEKPFCGVSFTAIARDGSRIQPFSDSVAGYGGYELARAREERAGNVVRTAMDLLRAESVPGGYYDVIIDPRLAGVFIHEAFGHLSEADFVYENEELKKHMVLGKTIGPPELNVIDDGGIPGLPGYIPADDEGVPPEKTYLIKNGTLEGRLHSRETAYKMNEPLSGNARALSVMHQPIVRMTNTYIDRGSASPESLFESLEDGLYVCDAQGGQTNLEMFTFSAGYAREVKGGKTGKLVRDIMLSGNVFKTLMSIDGIAGDLNMYGGLGGCGKGGQSPLPVSFGGPHLLVRNVLIGGRRP
ncbi:MAG TPA: TldD/PmbA family protein [Spirochaetes bacterium]|nr:TldD/PmbA family protein [Spirochaetota bacterium]